MWRALLSSFRYFAGVQPSPLTSPRAQPRDVHNPLSSPLATASEGSPLGGPRGVLLPRMIATRAHLWRLLASGATLAKARLVVLAKAAVCEFPRPPASRRSRPTFDTIDTRTATIQ